MYKTNQSYCGGGLGFVVARGPANANDTRGRRSVDDVVSTVYETVFGSREAWIPANRIRFGFFSLSFARPKQTPRRNRRRKRFVFLMRARPVVPLGRTRLNALFPRRLARRRVHTTRSLLKRQWPCVVRRRPINTHDGHVLQITNRQSFIVANRTAARTRTRAQTFRLAPIWPLEGAT